MSPKVAVLPVAVNAVAAAEPLARRAHGKDPERLVRRLEVSLRVSLTGLHAQRQTVSVTRSFAPDGEGDGLFEIAARLAVGECRVALVRERHLAEERS